MANRSVRSRIPQGGAVRQRRETLWVGFTPTETTFTATGGTLLFSLSAAGLALRPFTIVRTRLNLYIRSDQVAAREIQSGAVGVAVVSEQAEAIGISAIPTPVTDLESDLWLLWTIVQSSSTAGSDGGVDGKGMEIDSKAMRKVADGDQVVVVGELSGLSNGFQLTVGGRMLLKLH